MVSNRVLYKHLNNVILGEDFVDKPDNEYLYASLTQPPIRVIDRKDSDDELDWIVECPNCKRHVSYGYEMFMVSGHLYCNNEKCRKEVYKKVGYED